mmetsp:Transcript_9126/g.19934  ORF Transcript_9126/g.19934 Transcript_9126/m.19934 type:complete len:217 (+) Transcript_9126:815-1465(+)
MASQPSPPWLCSSRWPAESESALLWKRPMLLWPSTPPPPLPPAQISPPPASPRPWPPRWAPPPPPPPPPRPPTPRLTSAWPRRAACDATPAHAGRDTHASIASNGCCSDKRATCRRLSPSGETRDDANGGTRLLSLGAVASLSSSDWSLRGSAHAHASAASSGGSTVLLFALEHQRAHSNTSTRTRAGSARARAQRPNTCARKSRRCKAPREVSSN